MYAYFLAYSSIDSSASSNFTSLISSNLVVNKRPKNLTNKEFYKKQLKRFAKNLKPLHIKEYNNSLWYLKIYHVMKVIYYLIN